MAKKPNLKQRGAVIRTHQADGVDSVAVYDPTEVYRFYLERTWDSEQAVVAFIGLNPSTATEYQNDPTVNRCQNFAAAWGYGGFIMLNAYGLRSTDPRGLKTIDDPVGSLNNHYTLLGVERAALVMCCWGTHAGLGNRHEALRELLKGREVHCFRRTKAGYPNHPLYLRNDSRPVPYWTPDSSQ
ncbi:MAG: DUF1643 domain-containing protein [Planctomycetaceae bacterium]|nr:DUF1643 domain-containing protein [Planctomycetaceae bacterium]